jgi:drug/metabolite transporter (DMT)-like permease|tara:strand:+ start:138 stop:1028 length:891 start_codon:yes stop_codon:yes gene_type:complete
LLDKNTFGIVIVLLSSLCFAIVPSSAKISLDFGSSLFVLLFSRCLIGLVLLYPLVFFQKESIFISRKFLLPVFFSSLVSVSLIASVYHAIEFINIALGMTIVYAFPIGIALITSIRGEENYSLKEWLSMFMVIFGLFILVYDEIFAGSLYGILICMISLILMTTFIYSSSKLANNLGSIILNFHLNLWSLIFLFLSYFLFSFNLEMPNSSFGLAALFFNGLFYILSYTLFFWGSRFIGVTRTSVLSLTDPIFATLIAMIFLNQFLSIIESLGLIVVLISIYIFEILRAANKSLTKN